MIRFTKLCTRHLPSLQYSLRHASTHCDVIIVGGGMIGKKQASNFSFKIGFKFIRFHDRGFIMARYNSSHQSHKKHSLINFLNPNTVSGNTAAVALGLEEHLEDKNILILDQATHRPAYTPDAGYNLRVINLTVGNQKFLNQCGVWDSVKQMR